MEEKQWFLYVVDHHEGPFTASEIKGLIRKGDAKTSSYVWREGFEDWVMMSTVADFSVDGPSGEGHGPAAFVVSSKENKDNPVLFMPGQPTVIQNAAADISGISDKAVVWCLNSNRAFSGPYSLSVILRMIGDGKASSKDSIWKEGWSGFVPISSIPELIARIQKSGAKKTTANAAAAALGLAGASVSKRSGFPVFKTLFIVLLLGGAIYQLTALGTLDPLYRKAGVLEKVKKVSLRPVPMPSAKELNFGFAVSTWESIRAKVRPVLVKYAGKIPGPLKKYIGVVQLPSGVAPKDVSKLEDAAAADLNAGARAAEGILGSNVLTPRFVVTSNLPDGTPLNLVLRGKDGMLLDSTGYLAEQTLALQGKIVLSQAFSQDGGRPLPQGQYTLSVLSGQQSILVEDVFLGGANDATYQTRLREFNLRINAWKTAKAQEILQITATLESIANESATKFFSISKMHAGAARASQWRKYSAKYSKLSDQLGAAIGKTTGDLDKTSLKGVADNLKQGFNISDQLHRAETSYLVTAAPGAKNAAKPDAAMAHVRELAGQLVSVLNSVKSDLKR